MKTTIGGVSAPAQRVQAHMIDCMRIRSSRGSQTDSILVRFGKQPASPAPNSSRAANSEVKFHAAPLKAWNSDQTKTSGARTRRMPNLSPNAPIGISSKA
jgi:hypothetical protein